MLAEFAGNGNTAGVRRLLDLGVDAGTVFEQGDGYWDVAPRSTAAARGRLAHAAGRRRTAHRARCASRRARPLEPHSAGPGGEGLRRLLLERATHTESVAALLAAGASVDGIVSLGLRRGRWCCAPRSRTGVAHSRAGGLVCSSATSLSPSPASGLTRGRRWLVCRRRHYARPPLAPVPAPRHRARPRGTGAPRSRRWSSSVPGPKPDDVGGVGSAAAGSLARRGPAHGHAPRAAGDESLASRRHHARARHAARAWRVTAVRAWPLELDRRHASAIEGAMWISGHLALPRATARDQLGRAGGTLELHPRVHPHVGERALVAAAGDGAGDRLVRR